MHFLGSTHGLSHDPAWTEVGDQPDGVFGQTAVSACDVKADKVPGHWCQLLCVCQHKIQEALHSTRRRPHKCLLAGLPLARPHHDTGLLGMALPKPKGLGTLRG